MKKHVVLLLSVLLFSGIVAAQAKIAVLNSQVVLEKSHKGSTVIKALEKYKNESEKKLVKMQGALKNLEKELKSPALNQSTREQKMRQFEDTKVTFQRAVKDAQKAMKARMQKELAVLEKELTPLIVDFGKSKGYTIVFDLARTPAAYYDETVDITFDVIQAVNAKYPAPAKK